jgi:hypothetical protein
MFGLFFKRRQPEWLYRIERKVNILMASFDDLNNALAAISDGIGKVNTDTQSLLAKITELQQNPPTGMTPDQQAALDTAVSLAQGIAGRVTEIDNLVPDPVPPTPETPAEPPAGDQPVTEPPTGDQPQG